MGVPLSAQFCLGIWQKRLDSWVRWWNTQIKVNPTQAHEQMGQPAYLNFQRLIPLDHPVFLVDIELLAAFSLIVVVAVVQGFDMLLELRGSEALVGLRVTLKVHRGRRRQRRRQRRHLRQRPLLAKPEPDILFLKHACSILRQSSNPVCSFSSYGTEGL